MNWINPTQRLFPLNHTVTTKRAHSLVCLPDRTTAENELRKLRASIRKDRPGISSTYTLRYFILDSAPISLFRP